MRINDFGEEGFVGVAGLLGEVAGADVIGWGHCRIVLKVV